MNIYRKENRLTTNVMRIAYIIFFFAVFVTSFFVKGYTTINWLLAAVAIISFIVDWFSQTKELDKFKVTANNLFYIVATFAIFLCYIKTTM